MPMPIDISQIWSFLGGRSYYGMFLPTSDKGSRPVTDLPKYHVPYCFTPGMKRIVQDLLYKRRDEHVMPHLHRDTAIDCLRPFWLC